MSPEAYYRCAIPQELPFCKNHDAAEDAAVMYTIMGCCKLAGVNVEAWLTYFLEQVHEYDNDYSLDIADFLP